jgi:hypothetical protein
MISRHCASLRSGQCRLTTCQAARALGVAVVGIALPVKHSLSDVGEDGVDHLVGDPGPGFRRPQLSIACTSSPTG